MGIVDRIMAQEATWEEIFIHNIDVMDLMIGQERANKHPADDCKKKYCKHGNKNFIQQMVDHRETISRELQVIRAGVTPSDVR